MTCLKLKSTAQTCKCTIGSTSEPFLLLLHADLPLLPGDLDNSNQEA